MSIRRLFFDTETTGLPKFPLQPSRLYNNYNNCRIVEIAWIITDDEEIITEKRYIIRPDGWTIPNQAFKIHGISQDEALNNGIDILTVFDDLFKDLNGVHYLVAHNIPFDVYVTKAEMHRYNNQKLIKRFSDCKKYCTLEKSRRMFKGQKNNLGAVYKRLFNSTFKAHTALSDTRACKDIFYAMKKLK